MFSLVNYKQKQMMQLISAKASVNKIALYKEQNQRSNHLTLSSGNSAY